MSTTDDIMVLADAYAAAKAEVVIRQDADSFWAVIWRERCARSGEKLRAAVNALVAGRHESVLERDSVVDRLAEVVAERDALLEWKAAANGAGIQQEQALMRVETERDALRQDVQRLSEALRQEIDPPTFMGEPVSLLRKPVKSIADIKECYCPQDKCQAPVIMGRQTPCIRKMKEQK